MSADLAQRFQALIGRIEAAQNAVRAGELIVLGTLEKDVAMLCRDVMNKGPEIAHSFKGAIADAISRLDELAADIANYKDTLTRK